MMLQYDLQHPNVLQERYKIMEQRLNSLNELASSQHLLVPL